MRVLRGKCPQCEAWSWRCSCGFRWTQLEFGLEKTQQGQGLSQEERSRAGSEVVVAVTRVCAAPGCTRQFRAKRRDHFFCSKECRNVFRTWGVVDPEAAKIREFAAVDSCEGSPP